jgi:hypothetical protein
MHLSRMITTLSVAMLLLNHPASADPTKIDVKVSGSAGALTTAVSANGSPLAKGTVVDTSGQDALITITCDANDPCVPVIAVVGGQILTHAGANPKTVTVAANNISAAGTNVVIREGQGGAKLFNFQLLNKQVGAGSRGGIPATGVTQTCVPTTLSPSYLQKQNIAHFVVTPGGSILQYPEQPVDENDLVTVHVFGPDNIVDHVEVARTSATRPTGALSVVGGGETLARFSAADIVCVERQFTLGDFAPGEATVEMYTSDKGTKTTLGSFKFNVNKLYDGILNFGPVWTRQLADTSFKLAPSGQDKIIVASEEKRQNITYVLGYTYYAWGKRDLEKQYDWRTHINPTLAFSINNMSDHALAGVTCDIGQILITAGVHFAHVTRLNSASGLQPGSKFTSADTDIPTAKRWEHRPFLGVTVDLRAANALLKALGAK